MLAQVTEKPELLLWLYLAAINLAAFVTFGTDKSRAKKDAWRVPEKRLFLLALLGGSLGANLGMHLFHHKTKHWYFRVGLPLILLLQAVMLGVGAWLLIR